ncbi:hypothetical protein RDI58_007190 [Solanum bulbocastanum]|uniref:Uncharacterized protein n=1 Tax=Solanum bulbocastanum TaxID=147425 RepID=A0AAN8YIM9_SOLBU
MSLPIWVLENFYQRKVENGTEADLHRKIRCRVMRFSMWDAPNNEGDWRLFLTHLTGTIFSGDYYGSIAELC